MPPSSAPPNIARGLVLPGPIFDPWTRIRSWFSTPLRLAYHDPMDYAEIITVEPGKRGGQPCIRGIRITVYDVLSYLASGMTEEEILSDFPDLTHDDIVACLAYAADRERKTKVSHG